MSDANIGLTFTDSRLLLTAEELGSSPQVRIAEYMNIEQMTLVPQLDRLEALDLVCRTVDTTDRRRRHVTLTSNGSVAAARAREVFRNASSAITDGLQQDERIRFARYLETVASTLRKTKID